MKRLKFIIITLASIFLISAGTATAQEEGFVHLFNSKDLGNWLNVNCAPETWTVSDGIIVCTGIPKGVLRTDRQFENYILELEWRHMKEGGNAGLFVHSGALPVTGKPFTRSIECQIMDGNHGDVFAIQGATLTPDNANPRKGYICLESEGSEVHFRNIRIKVLPASDPPPEVCGSLDTGFRPLYNGLDLRGWKVAGENRLHWEASDWVLKYDGGSTQVGEDAHLWTAKEYGDFILMVDWRQPREPLVEEVPVILPDGSQARDPEDNGVTLAVKDAGDSGIYLRGSSKCQVNIWNWPVGSGEIWGYRTDPDMPEEVRRATTPMFKADNPTGQWNRFIITVTGNRVTVVLNGHTVIREARLPGLPERGPIALQHHGDPMEFANIYIKEL